MKNKLNKLNKPLAILLFVALVFTTVYQHVIINEMRNDVEYVRFAVGDAVIGHIKDLDLTLRVMLDQQRKEIDAELEKLRATEQLNFETLSFNKEEIFMRIDSSLMEMSDIHSARWDSDEMLRMEFDSLREYIQERHLAYDALLEKTSALENILEDLRNPLLQGWNEKLQILQNIAEELKAVGE